MFSSLMKVFKFDMSRYVHKVKQFIKMSLNILFMSFRTEGAAHQKHEICEILSVTTHRSLKIIKFSSCSYAFKSFFLFKCLINFGLSFFAKKVVCIT